MGHYHPSQKGDSHNDHSEHHHGTSNKKALGWSFTIITIYMLADVIDGVITNSLALLSDAGHMFSDSAALGLSYVAMKFWEKKLLLLKHLDINVLKFWLRS